MNRTKKITQGAMMLAIIGALIGIDRISAYWFSELIVLMIPVVLIMYCALYTLKDGLVLSVGLLIISFLLGNFQFTYLLYVPVGIATGLAYSFGVSRNFDRTRLLMTAIAVYVVGEVICSFIVYPLMGFPLATMIEEYKLTLSETGLLTSMNMVEAFSNIGVDFSKIIVVIYIISIILMGIMEGVLIHIVSIFLLKRFKIKDLGRINIFDIKPKPLVAYLALFAQFGLVLANKVDNEILYYVLLSIAIIGIIVLFYYGYLFLVLFGSIVLHRNIGAFLILIAFFVPVLLSGVLLLGYLYGAGPLRNYLESKVRGQQ
ncbi:MAG: DUF2232 domain-containing protein [Erysipelotrichaceae bacterium]|nr:DUF2232 domain-containing protein [Erysipelotrichaceae bacterium]